MELTGGIAQTLAALGILNVWILRWNKETQFRGGDAKNLREEFAVYGFPSWVVYATGAVKISLALLLLIGLWVSALVRPAALALGVLMVGAVAMHVRAGDRPKKALPASTILVLSLVAAIAG